MRYGSMCSGIGGLDLAVEAVWPGAEPAWFCEADPAATSILGRHWPGVPVYPDVKTQDWGQVEPVELVCFGFPCQDLSYAGRGAGIEQGTRSGLYWDCLAAVRVLRPRSVVVENVAALLTRRDGWDFNLVLSGLAEAGYDAEWGVFRASDVGAAHRRERVFIVAHPIGQPVRVQPGSVGIPAGAGQGEGNQRQRVRADDSHGRTDPHPEPDSGRLQSGSKLDRQTPQDATDRNPRREHADGLGDAPADAARVGCERGGAHGDGGLDLRTAVADAHGLAGQTPEPGGRRLGPLGEPGAVEGTERLRGVAWGDYEPAIRRWEHAVGRPAPAPTDEKGRLAVPFVEWMMGFEPGWVDGITRTAALRCLGNAVVQQQGAAALAALRKEQT